MYKKPPNFVSTLWTMMKDYEFYKDIPKVIKETLAHRKDPNLQMENFEDFLPIGSQAPDFELLSLEGEKIRLAEHQGKYVVLEFGAYT